MLRTQRTNSHRAGLSADTGSTARRAFDFAFATATLIAFTPIMILIAAAIWVESGRPIIFSQIRFGFRGQDFRMYKFRKFHCDCGPNSSPLTMENDPRLTSIGKFLQSTKLDELPQLWNILIGDMSFVGPRPETQAFEDCFAQGFEKVLEHKPGIFGPSQVLFRNESALYSAISDPQQFYRDVLFPTKAQLDLAYYPNRTMLSDMGWIARGALAVFGIFPASTPRLPVTDGGGVIGKERTSVFFAEGE